MNNNGWAGRRSRKSSYSGADGGCVEVGEMPGLIAVRDSKDAGGPWLNFAPKEWERFMSRIKVGEPSPRLSPE